MGESLRAMSCVRKRRFGRVALVRACSGIAGVAVLASIAPGAAVAETTLAEIEACASRNLPAASGVIGFRVDAVDRSGAQSASRAELLWRKPDAEPTRILLRVSEPARTAGTALLIIDRAAEDPEFFVRLPEMREVKRIRSRRLRGPVLGTDFSYEDLQRLREPLDRAELELAGTAWIDGEPAWLLETIPGKGGASEYSRVLTYVDQASCLPLRIDLFERGVGGEDRLRKRLDASRSELRPAAGSPDVLIPHEFVMQDLRRETRTVVRIERFEASLDLPAEHFTRAGLADSRPGADASTPP